MRRSYHSPTASKSIDYLHLKTGLIKTIYSLSNYEDVQAHLFPSSAAAAPAVVAAVAPAASTGSLLTWVTSQGGGGGPAVTSPRSGATAVCDWLAPAAGGAGWLTAGRAESAAAADVADWLTGSGAAGLTNGAETCA